MTLSNKLFLILLLSCFSFSIGFSQNAYLNSQAEVDAFDSSITFLSGNLWLRTTDNDDPIVDISNLTNLSSIGGDLVIQENPALTNLDNLANLMTVGGNLNLQYNEALTSISGFTDLNSIGGFLNIAHNDVLGSITDFANLSVIGGNLFIENNPALTNVDDFYNLSFLGGFVRVSYNDVLTTLAGFTNLTALLGELNIYDNNALSVISGFANVTSINGFLSIKNHPLLSNLNGLSNLISTEGNFHIVNNDGLTNLDAFANLASIGGNLQINNNATLTDCCAIQPLLENQDAIEGSITITSNPFQCNSVSAVLSAMCPGIDIYLNIPCIGASNGSIQVQMTGTIAPYTYSWQRLEDGQIGNGSSNDADFVIGNLSAGTYNLIVVDAAGAEFTEDNIILIPLVGSVFEIIELTTTNSTNGLNNGAIHLTVTGGSPPYTVSWSGNSAGTQNGISEMTFTIPSLTQGAYEITVTDDLGNQQMIEISLLDETVPVFPCTQPLDIVILNDVSSSVDPVEYNESQQFFADFLSAANIGPNPEESRAAIVEWSDAMVQDIRIPITDNLSALQDYISYNRTFSGGTNPHDALTFGEEYLATNARPGVERVLILSTDGTSGQISPSLIALADQYKAAGYHIVTIAFDGAYDDPYIRDILRQVASIDLLAPGAPAYSQLNQSLAENIVNLYLCPIDPGSSATAYFNRDGAIDIIGIEANGDCPNPRSVEITFTISALQELSLPSGTPVAFYYNNPALSGATPMLNWQIPCAIPAGTTETFTVSLPINGAANIFAILNDNGNQLPPIDFPITDIVEIAYSNNISDTTICTDPLPTLQAFKHAITPMPICNNMVIYTVDVCNITDLDATGVIISDDPPNGFVLLHTVINDNGCSTDNGGSFAIPGGCCVSITYTYSATDATNGNYNDQDVQLSGPGNQIYLDFEGANTSEENVLIDGSVDCPSTIINFTKTVNVTDICEDAFVVYTFTIDNQLNIPLQSLYLTDLLPEPVTWVFQPYNLNGLSTSNATLEGGSATFFIDEIAANTIATFSMDAALGNWATDGILNNIASLGNVPNLENGDIQTLTSNSVMTNVSALPEILITQNFNCSDNSVNLSATFDGQTSTSWTWVTTGDGFFSDSNTATPVYTMGNTDISNGTALLSVTGNSACGEISTLVSVVLDTPEPVAVSLEVCEGETVEYHGTTLEEDDHQEFMLQDSNGCDSIVSVTVLGLPNSNEEITLEVCEGSMIDYDGTLLAIGDIEVFTYHGSQGCDSIVTVTVVGLPSSEEMLTLQICEGNSLDYQGIPLEVGDTHQFAFSNNSGCDSIIHVTVEGLPTTHQELTLETCTGVPLTYEGIQLFSGDKYTFAFENSYGCDSTITVNVREKQRITNTGVPNIFSPNNDGVNDCFRSYFADDLIFQAYKLQIFNRWGGLVFSTTDPYLCWDGSFKGQPLKSGVYVWFIEMQTDDCTALSLLKGDVTLLR